MKTTIRIALAIIATFIWGAAGADTPTPQWGPSGIEGVETSTPEVLSLAKGKKVFVEFVNSPKLSTVFAEAFKKNGAVVVEGAQDADFTVHMEGKYKAIRPATGRRGEVDIGAQMEKSGEIVTKDHQVGIWISQGMGTLTPLQASGVVSAVDLFARASGFRDWFNSKVSGDPDGVCLAGCGPDRCGPQGERQGELRRNGRFSQPSHRERPGLRAPHRQGVECGAGVRRRHSGASSDPGGPVRILVLAAATGAYLRDAGHLISP